MTDRKAEFLTLLERYALTVARREGAVDYPELRATEALADEQRAELLKFIGEGEADDISKPKPCPLCGQDPITKISDKTGQTLYTCRRAAICSATWFTLDEWNCLQFYFAHQEGEADAGNL